MSTLLIAIIPAALLLILVLRRVAARRSGLRLCVDIPFDLYKDRERMGR